MIALLISIITPQLALANTPYFYVNKVGSTQTLPTGDTASVIEQNNIILDTAGYFDDSTYRYTPQVAGLYSFTVSLACTTPNDSMATQIRKNGSTSLTAKRTFMATSTSGNLGAETTVINYMNGTTDYVEHTGTCRQGGAIAVTDQATHFYGYLIPTESNTGTSTASTSVTVNSYSILFNALILMLIVMFGIMFIFKK